MRQTTFTTDEQNLLKGLLEKRLDELKQYSTDRNDSDKKGWKRFDSFYIKPIVSALDKISRQQPTTFDSKEKLAFTSCINEHYDDLYKQLKVTTAFSWLTISDEQKMVIAKLDLCKDILVKSGYYKQKQTFVKYNLEFRYNQILTTVEKLKKSDKIFLSKVGENDFYKIAFVYDSKEFLPFELKHKVSLRDIQFASLREQTPEEYARDRFSLTTTKDKAKEMLSTCDTKYYPDGVLEFMNHLLN